ncbi:MAG: DUF4878 domain-containing protein [Chitinophagaceae bacterium]|nr:DUF4878 domain-containing protein [Chitinophagaceae bacterium]
MKQKFYRLLSCCFFLFSCQSNNELPNTDIDVARAFIKDIQQSNFTQAEKLMLKEETNNQYFDRFEEHFKSRPKEELELYKNADIIINEMTPVSDSVTIINYSNSFNKNEKNKLKVVRVNGQWLIDLKYTFSGNL